MSEIKIGKMLLGSLSTNTYFLYRAEEKQAIVVDPADNGFYIYEGLKKNGIQVKAIFLTHGHADHIWGIESLKKAASEDGIELKVYAMEEEEEILESAGKNLSKFLGQPYTMKADVLMKDGEELSVEGMSCKVILTPGHTKGSCCFYFEEAGILVSGDTLFLESTGRSDFPTGSTSTLVRSIREKLFCLPKETTVYPGHGDSTTIGHEMKYNPFVADSEL